MNLSSSIGYRTSGALGGGRMKKPKQGLVKPQKAKKYKIPFRGLISERV